MKMPKMGPYNVLSPLRNNPPKIYNTFNASKCSPNGFVGLPYLLSHLNNTCIPFGDNAYPL